jgi:hypothetical protein
MKNAIVAFIILSVFSRIGYAQSEINFGIKGGLNYSSFSGTTKWTSQYAIGGLIEFQFGSISIQPEILYSVKGNKSDEIIYVAGKPYDVVFTEALTYIDIPLLLKIHLHLPLEKYSLLIGPSLGFLINANQHIAGSGIVSDNDNKIDYVNKESPQQAAEY